MYLLEPLRKMPEACRKLGSENVFPCCSGGKKPKFKELVDLVWHARGLLAMSIHCRERGAGR